MSTPKISDRLFKPGFSNMVDRLGDEAEQAKAAAAEAQREKEQAEQEAAKSKDKSTEMRRRGKLALKALKLGGPGLVLSFGGFAVALAAEGESRLVLLALALFTVGMTALVAAIGRTSDRIQNRHWRARRDSNPRPIA